jgi:hypothetical protein
VTNQEKIILTPEQEAKIPLWREQWRRHLFSTEPADRETAEKAALALYKQQNVKPPKKLVWLESPFGIEAFERHQTRPQVIIRAYAGIMAKTLGRQVKNFYHKIALRLQFDDPGRLSEALPDLIDDYMTDFGQLSIAGNDLAAYDFCRRVLKLRSATNVVAPEIELAKSVGMVWPTKDICFFVERWSRFSVDTQGRIHSVTGPAVQFRDGSEFYAYHGVADGDLGLIFRAAHTLSIDRIFELGMNRRNFAIEVYKGGRENGGGLERFVHDLKHSSSSDIRNRIVALDHDPAIGTLYHINVRRGSGYWTGQPPLAVVSVRNSTPEPDGSVKQYCLRVPPTIRTARAAVAWTFRLPRNRYRPVQET